MTPRGVLLGCLLLLGAPLVPTATAERPLLATHDAPDEGGAEENMELEERSEHRHRRMLLHRVLVRPHHRSMHHARGGSFHCPSPTARQRASGLLLTTYILNHHTQHSTSPARQSHPSSGPGVRAAWVTGQCCNAVGALSGAYVYAMLSGVRMLWVCSQLRPAQKRRKVSSGYPPLQPTSGRWYLDKGE